MTQLNIFANYYFNFGFNVTHISAYSPEYNKNLKSTIHHWDKKLKSPTHEWTDYYRTRQTLASLNDHDWSKAHGLGVVLGIDNLRALDIDDCDNIIFIYDMLSTLNLPPDYEWVIRSGSHNGFHILFYADDHKYANYTEKIKAFKPNHQYQDSFEHIELRWHGHLVLPPSIHPSFNHYEFINGEYPYNKPLDISLDDLDQLIDDYCRNNNSKNITSKATSTIFFGQDSKETSSIQTLQSDIDRTENVQDHDALEKGDDELIESSDPSAKYLEVEDFKENESSREFHIEEADYNETEDSIEFYIHEEATREIDDSTIHNCNSNFEVIFGNRENIDTNYYNDPYYLFFDTETTGLPKNWKAPLWELSNWPRLVQLAYVLFDRDGNRIFSNSFIIKPVDYTIPEESSRIHGITTEHAEQYGQSIHLVLNNFILLAGQASYLVAHNMSFDEKIIGSELIRNKMENTLSAKRRICTMKGTSSFCAIVNKHGYKWPSLSELHYKLFKSEFEEAHNAKIDVEATSRCFWELRRLGKL